MELALSSSSCQERTIVHVAGEIDVYTAPVLRRYLDEQIHQGVVDLVVDLGQVTFLDSTGLGVLVGRLRFMRQHGGSMVLVSDNERVLKVFGITGLDRVFDIRPTLTAVDGADRA